MKHLEVNEERLRAIANDLITVLSVPLNDLGGKPAATFASTTVAHELITKALTIVAKGERAEAARALAQAN